MEESLLVDFVMGVFRFRLTSCSGYLRSFIVKVSFLMCRSEVDLFTDKVSYFSSATASFSFFLSSAALSPSISLFSLTISYCCTSTVFSSLKLSDLKSAVSSRLFSLMLCTILEVMKKYFSSLI